MRRPTPILFTIPNFITAGSGRAMLNIIERLDPREYAPGVCVMKKGGDLDRVVEQLGIPFIEAPFTVPAKPYQSLAIRLWRAAQVFRPYGFRIWHSFHYSDDYTEPLIARLAGASAWVYTKKNMNWHSRSWYLRTLFATRVAAQNTDMMRDFFAQPRFRRHTLLVPRGVNPEKFRPQAAGAGELRERLGLSAATVVAACVAHLLPVKGHPTLIEAVARVPHLHLVIAGKPMDQQYASELRDLVERLGLHERVHFIGGVDDVPRLLADIDIFVLPSWARWRMEGCPVALLEAMACGKACVATAIPGSRDLIEDGISGRVVPPEDPDALAIALAELATSGALRTALGQAARGRVMQHFTIDREVKAHESLYDGISST